MTKQLQLTAPEMVPYQAIGTVETLFAARRLRHKVDYPSTDHSALATILRSGRVDGPQHAAAAHGTDELRSTR